MSKLRSFAQIKILPNPRILTDLGALNPHEMIQTERLFLVPASLELLAAAARNDEASLSALLGGVGIAEQWSHFPEAMDWMHRYLLDHPGETDWWSYFIVHKTDVRLIGTAGYKGPPDPAGTVEIGYEIADAYQGKGFATEAAAALIEHAGRQGGVMAVQAHTLAEENASVALLRKLGFKFMEEKIDLQDGRIWLWQKNTGQEQP